MLGGEGWEGVVVPPNIFKFVRKLVQKQPCCKRVVKSILCDRFFIAIIVGQLAITPPPPTEGVSAHHCMFVLRNVTFANNIPRPYVCFL